MNGRVNRKNKRGRNARSMNVWKKGRMNRRMLERREGKKDGW